MSTLPTKRDPAPPETEPTPTWREESHWQSA